MTRLTGKAAISQSAFPGGKAAPLRSPLKQMAPDEVRAWLEQTREALQRKMRRERDYLDRRARRGVRTPTDEAYEHDQALEADLLRLLDEIEETLGEVLP
ncbi:MAG TPA: hypothetical protein VKV40_10870 [Ktedonobacteraceae bacterium]|nr:hypothetical protein [Ktedonobacteraceae bacterium]